MCYNSSITSTKKVWKCSPIWRVFVVDKVTPSLSPNKENVFRNLADNCQYYLIRLSEGYSLKDNIYGTKVILTFSWYSILHYCYFIYVVYKWAPLFKTLKEQKKKTSLKYLIIILIIILWRGEGERVLRRRILEGRSLKGWRDYKRT